jgi:RNA polymerase sigma-70 factor (ECF subfamily)
MLGPRDRGSRSKPVKHVYAFELEAADVEDFQTLYRDNFDLIYYYVLSKVANRQEAEDLTSQVFLKVVRGLDLKRDPRSLRSWLVRVARTTLADYWRIHYRGTASSLDGLLEAGWEGPVDEEAALMKSSATELVQEILQALPEREREVLTSRFLLNLSIRETAIRMGLTEANTKVLQYRALKRAAGLEGLTTKAVHRL